LVLLLLDPGEILAQNGDCLVRLSFPGRQEILQESSFDDPIEIDLERDIGLMVDLAGPESFAGRKAKVWIELGGVRIDVLEETVRRDRFVREVLPEGSLEQFDVPPGIYHVGGSVENLCSGDGYVRVAGNPLSGLVGQAALGALLVGLLGTWFAGRPLRGPKEPSQPKKKETVREFHVAVPDHTIQARIYDDSGRVLTRGFLPDTNHRIEVQFNPTGASWIGASSPTPSLQGDAQGSIPIRVVLTEPRLLDAPEIAHVQLAESGPSSIGEFSLTTRPDTSHVDARLIVLSGNRVLQTARLPAEIIPMERSPAVGPPADRENVAEVETVVRGSSAGLAQRRPFDAAFVVNHDDRGAARATGITEDGAVLIDLDEVTITEAVEKVRKRLGEIVEQPEQFTGLEAAGTRELLVFLAHHGRIMRNALTKDFLGPALAGSSYIQVVSARPDAHFPFEFAYDYPAPGEDAAVCPDARAALDSPDFAKSCPGTHHEGLVCPFGFWGISKVIERHAFQPASSLSRGFLIRGQPSANRNQIQLNGGMVFAASQRVDGHESGSVARLLTALAEPTNGRLSQANSWNDWTTQVSGHRPALLLLLPHTVYSDVLDTYGLEIGIDDRCWAGDIDERFLPPEDRPVVVALLGCETAAAGKVGYERFPGLFRRAGAEIVIGTLTEILGRHAAPVAQGVVQLLYTRSREAPKSFGELMVEVRRRYLAEGMPMVLALVAFGDADWVVTGDG
jgi:hypothetical protein